MRHKYEQLYAIKLGNLDEIDKFWGIQNLAKLNQKEIEDWNSPITSKDIESVIIISQQRKGWELMLHQ